MRRLLERFGSVEGVLLAKESELREVEGIGNEVARQVASAMETISVEEEVERAASAGVTILHQEDPAYPESLREIYDPPLVLYVKGKIPEKWHRGVAVVGTRKPTHYGEEQAKRFGYQIAYARVPVISGLARGVDTGAHLGALAAKGTTWAVLGCGLGHCYPPENESLATKIVEEGGCLMSEFPMQTKPDRQTFPMRNRIVSGLSFGVLVVEAGKESGAMITARQALDQGRQVFAVPGRIDNPEAKGCLQLLKEGARLVEGVEDILSELQYLLPPEPMAKNPVSLEGVEAKVFEVLGVEEWHLDQIIQKTGLPSGQVSSTLLRLEMKKLVRQLPGKYFVRTA